MIYQTDPKGRITSVAIVEDEQLVRELLIRYLSGCDGVTVIEALEGGDSVITRLARQPAPDVALVDLNLHGRIGFDVTYELRNAVPQIRIVILTVCEEPWCIKRVFDVGASGYVSKLSHKGMLKEAIYAVMRGEQFIDSRVSERVALASVKRPAGGSLTERQLKILRMLAHGNTNGQIGAELGISRRTVAKHRDDLMRRVGARNLAELIQVALSGGLVTWQPTVTKSHNDHRGHQERLGSR